MQNKVLHRQRSGTEKECHPLHFVCSCTLFPHTCVFWSCSLLHGIPTFPESSVGAGNRLLFPLSLNGWRNSKERSSRNLCGNPCKEHWIRLTPEQCTGSLFTSKWIAVVHYPPWKHSAWVHLNRSTTALLIPTHPMTSFWQMVGPTAYAQWYTL